MAYEHAPPEVNSELIFGSGRTGKDTSEPPEMPASGIVTVVDIDDEGNVTKTVMNYRPAGELAIDD